MDGRLSFDVYAEITDPHWRVAHQPYDYRVSAVIGGPPGESPPINLLQLWFKEPDTVIELGRELVTAGVRLKAQLANRVPSVAGGPDAAEVYPVPEKKSDVVAPDANAPGDEAKDG